MNSETDGQTLPDSDGRTDRSLDNVLERLQHVERSLGQTKKPWFLTPSNLISLLAVVVTVLMFFTNRGFQATETRFQKLQQLGQVIDQISSLASKELELYRTDVPPHLRHGALMTISNRRVALVNQADRLVADLDGKPFSKDKQTVSKVDRALLAAAYISIGRYKEAEKYFLDLARTDTAPLAMRVSAERTLISLYTYIGRDRITAAEEAAARGLNLVKLSENDVGLQTESVRIPYVLASYFSMVDRYDKAIPVFLKAERSAWELPCMPLRQELLKMVRAEVAKLLQLHPVHRSEVVAARSTYTPRCPTDPPSLAKQTDAQHTAVDLTYTYVGDYNSATGPVSVRETPEKYLTVAIGQKSPWKLVPIGHDIFSVQAAQGYFVAFQRDDAKNVTHILFLQPNGLFSASRD